MSRIPRPSSAGSERDPRRFALLAAQLAALLAVFHVYRLESSAFEVLGAICFAGFAVHYWLPASARRAFYVLYSMAAAFAILDWRTVVLLHGAGLALFAVIRLPIAYAGRTAIVAAIGAGLLVARSGGGGGVIPDRFWPVLGAVFMFRMIVYLYDLRHAKAPPSLLDYLSYFYMIPNYYFLLFPVVDYETMLRTRGRGDLNDVAQTGIRWILRGTIQLLLYRLVVDARPEADPAAIDTLPRLLEYMLLTYLLYLRVSGQFHIAVGMLRLFGFALPETHRRYLLASSIPDFWRRINIYWKDFIVKVVYFPVFFALRRRSTTLATVVGTLAAFTATWVLHSYQWYWLRGEVLFTVPDVLFWAILGLLVLVSFLVEQRRGAVRPARPEGVLGRAGHGGRILATLLTIMVLWSLWQSATLTEWLDLMTFWSAS